MGVLFSYAYDVDSKYVSDRLSVLMYAAIENDTYVHHNAYIKCMYKDWNDLVMKFLYDKPTDQMLAEILGPARNSDASLFRRLNVPKYFSLDRHATIPTIQCSENETHWSEGPLVRLFKKEAH